MIAKKLGQKKLLNHGFKSFLMDVFYCSKFKFQLTFKLGIRHFEIYPKIAGKERMTSVPLPGEL